VIHPEHADLAVRFATRGADKFADAGFVADERGLPVLPRACVTLHCTAHAKHPGGDHTILLGQVEHIRLGEDPPAVYFRRRFHLLQQLNEPTSLRRARLLTRPDRQRALEL
jgi:flavin reductase ActVB